MKTADLIKKTKLKIDFFLGRVQDAPSAAGQVTELTSALERLVVTKRTEEENNMA